MVPAPLAIDARERVRAVAGAFVGLLHGCRQPLADAHLDGRVSLLAPLGASTVLVFAAPASPLAQPWSVVAGNVISALVGVACALLVPNAMLAAAGAVALAIAIMFALRCLHPPGGAMALLAVLMHAANGAATLPLGTAAIGSVLLVVAGMIYNTLTGRRYPHGQQAPRRPMRRAQAARP